MPDMPENTRPPFTCADARHILNAHYDITARACQDLPAELDRNFHLQSSAGAFVLKIAHAASSDSELDLQNRALRHLTPLRLFPALVPAATGQSVIRVTAANGETFRARLLRYIDGVPLRDFRPQAPDLLADIGKRLGEVSAAMSAFDQAETRRDYRWNIANLPRIAACAAYMPADKRALLDHFLALYKNEVASAVPDLRQGFCYNDANDTNILVRADDPLGPRVAGFIDLGDITHCPVIAELAVALAYIMMDAPRPLEHAAPLVAAYHRAFPLQEREIALLYPLVAARLCLSVCISHHQQRNEPDNRHLSVSEDAAWKLLRRLRNIHPRRAQYVFRAACGLPAPPHYKFLRDWLAAQDFAPILGYELTHKNSRLVDLGMESDLLADISDLSDPACWTAPLDALLDGKIGIGHYSEVRPIYLTDMFAVEPGHRRALHLGLDVFAPAGTPIFAPLAGKVAHVAEQKAEQDYGPMLIVEHQPRAGLRFYTLYGHLAADALERWPAGDPVAAGQLLARIGDYPRNGNWTPHLHFQIVADLLDMADQTPGVGSTRERQYWTTLCPDPNLILKLPFSTQPPAKPTRARLMERRRDSLNPALSLSYRSPLKIARGFMQYLYDEDGQRYLDCVNNVAHVGHGHPRIVAAARRQMARLNTNTRYLHDTIIDYAEALRATLPDALSVCFFVNSGSEANELALRLAAARTGGRDIIVIDHAYHGHTSALVEISPYKFKARGGRGQAAHVQVARMPDAFRGEMRGYSEDAGSFYAESAGECIDAVHARGGRLSAFVAEGILACGGQMPLPAGYLRRAYDMARTAGGVCIADEVQTGFGRVGDAFWSFELGGVVPDIVTMGKPIGNGHPLGAVVTTPEIAAAFNNGMEYFNTFGGNPVACAVGLEVLRVIEDEALQDNARDAGAYWRGRLREMRARFPIIGDARGSGLFMGIELVRDRETLEAADWETNYVVERMKGLGVLVSAEGPLGNVLKLKPPMRFGRDDVDDFVAALADVLGDTALA